MEKVKETPKKLGFIKKILRKIFLKLNLIDESVYFGAYYDEKKLSFFLWLLDVMLYGVLWNTVLLIPIMLLNAYKYIPISIISIGTLCYLIRDIYGGIKK